MTETRAGTWSLLTEPGLYHRDGAAELGDGPVVLQVYAVGQPQLVVGLGQEAAVCIQVLLLQLQTLLEVVQGLGVVP